MLYHYVFENTIINVSYSLLISIRLYSFTFCYFYAFVTSRFHNIWFMQCFANVFFCLMTYRAYDGDEYDGEWCVCKCLTSYNFLYANDLYLLWVAWYCTNDTLIIYVRKCDMLSVQKACSKNKIQRITIMDDINGRKEIISNDSLIFYLHKDALFK